MGFEPLRILHLTFSLENAGKENLMVDIATEQQKLGHIPAIVVVNNKVDESILARIPHSVTTYLLNRFPGSVNPIPFIKLIDILNRRFRPDVVHSHDVHLGKLLKKIFTGRLVLTIHGLGIDAAQMKSFGKLFAISNAVKKDVEDRSNLLCHVVYNGIKTLNISRKKNYSKANEFRIVFVSRLNHEIKGHDLLINAISKLVHKKKISNIMLDLIGDGESLDLIKKMIADLNLQTNISLLGNKNREWIYFNLCSYHLFVHPGRNEGFGLTVAEAMAAGVPVVSSDKAGPAELLSGGRYGLLFRNNDVDDLVEKIEQIINMYGDGTIGSKAYAAYNHCTRNYDISATAAAYCKLYPFAS